MSSAPLVKEVANGETISIPYISLLPGFPERVRDRFFGNPNSMALELPVSLVTAQLPKGKVQVTLGDLRRFSPEGAFSGTAENDLTAVDLPLGEILPRMKTASLSRRAGQKRLEVAEDIPSVFGPDAKIPLSHSAAAAKRPAAPTPPPDPVAEIKPLIPATHLTPAPMVAAPVAPPEPKTEEFKLPPLEELKPSAPIPFKLEPITPPKSPVIAPEPEPAPEAVAEGDHGETVVLPLSLFTSFWASAGKNDLVSLHKASAHFPVSALEKTLKTGKVIFLWSQFRHWISGTNNLPNLLDSTPIEFPLSVVAPQFLQSRKAATAPQRKVQVDHSIPDLFGGTTPAAPAAEPETSPTAFLRAIAPAAAETRASAAASMPIAPVKAAAGARPLLEFGEIFGTPQKKEWTLQEVVQKAAALRGVAGLLLCTHDGLLIAGQWPMDVKTDAVAGFIPPMYNRVIQYSNELKLGQPENFTLLIENLPLVIFKTGPNFLAALGKAGETLPKAQLTALALRLANS
jgi:predicted regulator of Ras-like GTPase activity (Roadblock/LC7/MglB family)